MINKIKTKVYIDGSNTYRAQKKLGWLIDWKKVIELFSEKYEVMEWRYYVGLKDEDLKMRSFINFLKLLGFNVITKPLKKIMIDLDDPIFKILHHTFIYKANFDVEITADMILDSSGVKEFMLFSGDSDFVYLIKRLKELGKETNVYSSRKTISWELKLGSNR